MAKNSQDPNIRYLVGCNHSMAAGTRIDPYSTVPAGTIFQPSLTRDDEVGRVQAWYGVSSGIVNEVDVALCTINPGKTGAFLVNDHPHGAMKVIAGRVTPSVGDSLVVMGAVSGKVVLDVAGVNKTKRLREGNGPIYDFGNLIKFTWPNVATAPRVGPGDSGAPSTSLRHWSSATI